MAGFVGRAAGCVPKFRDVITPFKLFPESFRDFNPCQNRQVKNKIKNSLYSNNQHINQNTINK